MAGSRSVHTADDRVGGRVVAALDPSGALGPWRGSGNVCVAIPDLTRPVDPTAALEALQARSSRPIDVIVGLGLHRRMTHAELEPLRSFTVHQHDPDDCCPTTTVDGIPGAINRRVANADTIVSVGIAELHQYAGISGGHKGVAVGCGGRATIAALHARDRVLNPSVQLGNVSSNPFRDAIDMLGAAARCSLALLWVPTTGEWLAGDPRDVVQAAAQRIQPWQLEPGLWSQAALTVPFAKATSFYQASRAATYLALSPNPPLHTGARIALDAACPEGLGHESGFVAALMAAPYPWTHLLTGPEPRGPGAQRAVMLARMAERYQIEVYGCADPEPLRRAGIPATRDPLPDGPDWLQVPTPFHRIPQSRVAP